MLLGTSATYQVSEVPVNELGDVTTLVQQAAPSHTHSTPDPRIADRAMAGIALIFLDLWELINCPLS